MSRLKLGLKFIVVLFTISAGLGNTLLVTSQAQLDARDQLEVVAPIPNSTVRGATELKYVVYDDDATSVPTRIEILNAACTVKQRTILNANLPSSRNQQVRGWNSAGGYVDGGALADGNYCLSICTTLKNGSQTYGLCRRQLVTLRNRPNNAPRITSTPSVKINQGDNYTYRIAYSDIDGDSLRLRVVQKPGFLRLNGSTLEGTNIQDVGQFKVVIEVTDNYGGLARQSYTLTVVSQAEPTPTPTPSPTPTPKPDDKPIELEFIYPINNSTLSGEENKVEWEVANVEADEIERMILEVAKEGEDRWRRLHQLEDGDEVLVKTSFDWDVTSYENGKYQLRLRLEVKEKEPVEVSSSVFEISNKKDDGEEPVTEEIVISQLSPANGAAIEEISEGKLSALITFNDDKNEREFGNDKVEVVFNGEIQNDCELKELDKDNYKLTCTVGELEPGKYSVSIAVPDYQTTRSWEFSIVEPETGEEGVDIQQYIPLIIIGSVVLCVLLLPLFLLAMLRRRRSYATTTTETTEIVGNENDWATTDVTELSIGDPFETNTSVLTTTPVATTTTETVKTEVQPVPVPVVDENSTKTEVTTTKTSTEKSSPFAKVGSAFQGLKDRFKRKPKPVKTETKSEAKTETKTAIEPSAEESAAAVAAATIPVPLAKPAEIKQPKSTADFLEDNFSLADNYPDDNPIAPVAAVPSPQATKAALEPAALPAAEPEAKPASQPPAPEPQPKPESQAQSQSTSQVVQTTEEDLPDWLKADADAADVAASTTTATNQEEAATKAKQARSGGDDDDGSDPYGFGEYSLGDPN